MNGKQKLLIRSIKLLPVLAVLIIGTFYLAGQFRELVKNAHVIISQELASRFDREVKIGGTYLSPLGTAVLEDVEIARDKKLADGKMVSVKRIVIHYDWRALVFKKKGAEAVGLVEVMDPTLELVRRKNGTFNVQDLLKPVPGPKRPPFRGEVRIFGANISFKDYLAKSGHAPVVNYVKDINANLDASDYPKYAFTLDGHGMKGRLGDAKAAGIYDSPAKSLKIDFNASEANPGYWTRYLGILRGLPMSGGSARVMMGIDYSHPSNKRAKMVLNGTVRGSGISTQFPGLKRPLINVGGRVVISGERVVLSMAGNAAGSDVQVAGTVTSFSKPKLDLFVTSPRTDYMGLMRDVKIASIPKQVRVIGRGMVRARVTGAPSDLTVNVVAQAPGVSAQGITAANVIAAGVYKSKHIKLNSLRLRAKGAQVVASGNIALSPVPKAAIQGRVSGLQLAALPIPSKVKVAGVVSGRFTASGTVANPKISLNANVRNGSINRVAFKSASARIDVVGREAKIGRLTVNGLARGVVTACGTANPNAVNLDVHVESLDLSRAGALIGRPGIGGVAFFDGKVSGKVTDPHVEGKLDVFRGRYLDNKIDYARAVFSGDMQAVNIKDAVVRLFPGELRIAGAAKGLNTGRVAFDGTAHVSNLDAKTVMSLLKRDLKVTGSIVGDFTASGIYVLKPKRGERALINTIASGELKVEDGTAFGYPISTASAHMDFADNRLDIKQAVVSSENAEVSLDGSVNADTRALDLSFKLSGFDLARVRDKVDGYVLLGGVANARGTVTGTIDNINANVSGGIGDLVLNNKRFDKASLDAAYSGGMLTSLGLKLQRESQVYSIAVHNYDTDTNMLGSLTGELTDVSVPDFWDILRASPFMGPSDGGKFSASLNRVPRLTSGKINGNFSIDGDLTEPNGSLDITAKNVGIDVQRIESIALKATAKKGAVTLDKFEAISGDTNITMTGDPVYADGQIKLDLEAHNFDLTHLRPWLKEKTPEGMLSADFHVRGDLAKPEIMGSAEVVNPSYQGVTFDRFRASNIRVADDKIEVLGVILASGSHQAEASGFVPWNWEDHAIPSDKALKFVAELKNQDLSMLSTFISRIDPKGTKGNVDGQVRITGTMNKPEMSGSLAVADGTVALKDFTNTFTGIKADLTFDGNKVLINQLSANSSLGGSLAAQPGSYISVPSLAESRANVLVQADKLLVGEKNLLGFQENVNMQLDAGLSVTGDPFAPEVKDAAVGNVPGGITISNAKLAFVMPEKMSKRDGMALPVDPKFNVNIRLGQNVLIEPPSMSLQVAGGGTIMGTLSAPKVGLTLDIQQGSMKLAAVRLRVVPGGSIAIHYSPPADPELKVDFQATSSVMARNQIGQRERYQINLGASGPIANLHVSLSSQPSGLSREQMLAALGHVEGIFTSGELGLQKELGTILTAVGTSTLFAPIESVFVDKLGFEQFTLESNAQNALAIYASRRLINNFYASIYRRVGPVLPSVKESIYEAILSYKYKREYSLSIGIDSQQTTTLSVGITRSF